MKDKYEDLKKILKSIKESVKLYNDLYPEEKIEVKKVEEKKDVKKFFICAYNEDCVGLFEKKDFSSVNLFNFYIAGSIFKGINSNYVGAIKTHEGSYAVKKYNKIGSSYIIDNNECFVNCEINDYIHFDDMRLKMYNDGVLTSYEPGKATSSEILEVLKYSYNYYYKEKTKKKK